MAPWNKLHRSSISLSGLPSASVIVPLCLMLLPAVARANGDPGKGKVLFALAAGCGCHSPTGGPVGAGGGEVPTPFGKFYGSNITPDPDTGIGAWSDAEIRAAIRDGVARGKGIEAPVMPYYLYAGMTDSDVDDLIAYLRTLPAVRRPNRMHEGELPLARWAYRAWRLLFVGRAAARMPSAGAEQRGKYLVEHVSICIDCHTPRTRWGTLDRSLYLAGTTNGPGGDSVPNITPHPTGIADWTIEDILNVLIRGMLPNFDNVQGFMADVVDGRGGGPGLKNASEKDLRAIATYLKSVPPIDNKVEDQ